MFAFLLFSYARIQILKFIILTQEWFQYLVHLWYFAHGEHFWPDPAEKSLVDLGTLTGMLVCSKGILLNRKIQLLR